MKITIETLNNAGVGLQKLFTNTTLAPYLKIRLMRLADAVEVESKRYNEVRLDLFRQHGKPIEGQKDNWTLEGCAPEAVEAVNNGWAEILKEEVELPGQPISFELLSGADLNVLELKSLKWLLKFSDEDAPPVTNVEV